MGFDGVAATSKSQAVKQPLQPIPFFYVGGIPQGAGLEQSEQASKHQGKEKQELFVDTYAFWRRWPPCQDKLLKK